MSSSKDREESRSDLVVPSRARLFVREFRFILRDYSSLYEVGGTRIRFVEA